MDFRTPLIDKFMCGIADIRISRHNLRRDIIVLLNNTEHDIYMDIGDQTERFRICKQAIVNKRPDMYYVQEQYGVFVEDVAQLPFTVALTMSGLPRPLVLDDRIIIGGTVYVVSKVKPNNRELWSILEVLIYPEREAARLNDPLALYKIRFRRGLEEVPLSDIYSAPVVMDIIYGGCPLYMSFDGQTWTPFLFQSRVQVPAGAVQLYIKDAQQQVVQLAFGEEFSVAPPPSDGVTYY